MKPKDYMIGDILMAHLDDEEKDFPVVLNGLDENGTLVDGDCEFSWRPLNKKDDDIQYADNLEPIKLTTVILGRNGFDYFGEMIDGCSEHWFYSDNFRVKVDIDILGSFDVTCGRNVIYDLHYVHQLQHALRLCGLNDIADNFKI